MSHNKGIVEWYNWNEFMNLVCIQANNSVNFIQQVFDAYASKKLFAIADCDSVEEFELSRGIVATEFIATSVKSCRLKKCC